MTSNQAINHNYIKLAQICRLFKTQDSVDILDFKAIVENFDVNYRLPSNSILSRKKPEYSGNTALHFLTKHVILYDDYEDSFPALLLKLGADLTITNDQGYTPLLLAFHEEFFPETFLEIHFESKNAINSRDKDGISHFHVACSVSPEEKFQAVEYVEFFLKAGAPVNERVNDDSPKYPGYTPLHFAAEHGYPGLSMIKLLLSKGANINSKDAKGNTPLHILIKNLMEISFFYVNNKLHEFLLNVACNNQHDDVGLWLLHLDCISHAAKKCNSKSVEQLLNQDVHINTFIKFDSIICPGYTPLHLASHFNLKSVKCLLLKGADLLAKDANNVTPLDICLKKFRKINYIIEILICEKRHQLSQIKFTDGTLLLDALQAMTTPDLFEQFLSHNLKNVNTFIPFQSLIWPGYSFLHLSVLFDCCVPNLLSHKANFTMINMDGLTPLHLAFCLERTKAVNEILNAHKRLPNNPLNRNNLSHLHIACAAKNIEVVELLLRNGADPNLPTLCNFEWCNYNHCFKPIETGSTPLHIAVATENCELIKLLLDYKANPHVAYASGITPFQYALKKFTSSKDIFKSTLKQMLETNIEILITGTAGIDILHFVLTSSQKHSEIVQRLVQKFDKISPYDQLGLTRLQVACCIGDSTMVKEELESGADVNQCISFDSSIWPGDSAMHILFRKNPNQTNEIAKLLFMHGANPTLKNSSNLTPIHMCSNKTLQTAISLLDKNFTNVNPFNNEELSHFHLSCKTTNLHIVREFLKSGVQVNATVDYFDENYPGWTPLHFAICYSSEEVVELLLNHGADHKITNADGLPPLHQAISLNLKINSPNRVETILRHPEVNTQDLSIFGDTILMTALKNDEIKENIVDLLLNIGAGVNLNWFTTENLNESNFIFNLATNFPPKIFQRLIVVIPCITTTDSMGCNALHYISSRYVRTALDKSNYKDNMEMLIENGCELDQKDNDGNTPLHVAVYYYKFETVGLLLECGADLNIKSDDGKTPVMCAFKVHSKELKSIFAQHLKKLAEVGLYVEECNKIYLHYETDEVSRDEIKEEMKLLDHFLKEEISVSFNANFFFTEKFVVDYRRMKPLQREKIRDFCNSSDLHKLYPNLVSLLNLQLRRARTRTRLLEPAQAAFNEFTNLILPNLCVDFIFDYLKNDDMMNLIRAKSGKLEFANFPKNC